jgi:hypothetical protein
MTSIDPHNERFLRDAFGSVLTDGACVIDHDREIGYVRLELGPHCSGPDSAYWDGWFNVTPTRDGNPLRGKAMKGDLVQVVRGGQAAVASS